MKKSKYATLEAALAAKRESDRIRQRDLRASKPEYYRDYSKKRREKAKNDPKQKHLRAEAQRRFRRRHAEKVKKERREKYLKTKDAVIAQGREWRENNRERHNETHRKWCAKNSQKQATYHKAWTAANLEKTRESSRKCMAKKRARDPESINKRQREFYKNNKELFFAGAAKRRALRINATPAWVDHAQIRIIFAEATRRTAETGIKMVVDHIVPLNSKIVCGLHVAWNLRVIPEKDNQSKSNVLIEDLGLAPTILNGLINK